ncbi:hypothetical protein E2C01_076226 [Portunus trituberculatus]|uniref:Uncharacterized protein n=1 Tax=Portunus trituberculatus TaxID=210409 RepID=A0A5B7I859_PORTR|nr:hypothetical protein [Portunus trituberculatus]
MTQEEGANNQLVGAGKSAQEVGSIGESGRRWVRNQHRSIEDWRWRSSGQKPASTRRLGIGYVRNVPVAKRTPA